MSIKRENNDNLPQDHSHDAVALVDGFLNEAVISAASDIHFEPTKSALIVKFRLDGELKIIDELPKSISDTVISRLKVLGGLLTYRNDIPQEGRIMFQPDCQIDLIDQRLAIFPTIHGQRAVVRLFYEEAGLADLKELGFSDYIHEILSKIADLPQGVLLLTGPAGSGKSTTLAAILRYINRKYPGKSIVTLEDPVERHIDKVTQVQIDPHGRMTFPTALRSLLRQDPQVLMIGEIRDAETARIAIEAGLTGHLLFSTLHSGTPAGALLRLLEMGIEPYQITSSILAVLNQRLLRKLCPKCKTKPSQSPHYQPVGCTDCLQTGYKGRMLIAEIVQLDGQLRQGILEKADLDQLENILTSRGHMTLYHDGQRLIQNGITTDQELARVCGVIKP